MLSQNLVQGWVKTWSKYVAQQNWTKFWLKKVVFVVFFFARFSLKSHSPCRKKKILKNKKRKKRDNLDQVLTQKKAIFGPSFDSTAYIYVCVCVCMSLSLSSPRFSLLFWPSSFFLFFCLLLVLSRSPETYRQFVFLSRCKSDNSEETISKIAPWTFIPPVSFIRLAKNSGWFLLESLSYSPTVGQILWIYLAFDRINPWEVPPWSLLYYSGPRAFE